MFADSEPDVASRAVFGREVAHVFKVVFRRAVEVRRARCHVGQGFGEVVHCFAARSARRAPVFGGKFGNEFEKLLRRGAVRLFIQALVELVGKVGVFPLPFDERFLPLFARFGAAFCGFVEEFVGGVAYEEFLFGKILSIALLLLY